ncbi:hypothetical protein [Streptosporangium sp. NBC_01469]|uniref:hypothetical protein n=1 Tax=Streptosporangium sp. NBC_01469 TaxID=2903898 RepID=UPI002E2908A4|nr:hypothetical protein [Streptosporangium sp. NBC_01469]
MSVHALSVAFSWALLAAGCVMAAHGVHVLMTSRVPRVISGRGGVLQVRPYGWSLLFFGLFAVSTASPRLLGWTDELSLTLFTLLALAFAAVALTLMAKAKKVLKPTTSRDREM